MPVSAQHVWPSAHGELTPQVATGTNPAGDSTCAGPQSPNQTMRTPAAQAVCGAA
jgi:hypothetical protein